MDLKTIRAKLLGTEGERAVSPVIGVILMVAITVILAAVIATLVMDIGGNQETPINSHVSSEVEDEGVSLTVTEPGEAERYVLRGAGVKGEVNLEHFMSPSTGSAHTVKGGLTAGEVNVVAIEGDREDQAGSFTIEDDWGGLDQVTVNVVEDNGDTIVYVDGENVLSGSGSNDVDLSGVNSDFQGSPATTMSPGDEVVLVWDTSPPASTNIDLDMVSGGSTSVSVEYPDT